MPQQLAHSSNWNSPPQVFKASQQRRTTKDKVRTKYWNRKSLEAFSFSNLWKNPLIFTSFTSFNCNLKNSNCSTALRGSKLRPPTAPQLKYTWNLSAALSKLTASVKASPKDLPSWRHEKSRRFCPQRSKKRNFWNMFEIFVLTLSHASGQPGFSDLSHGTIDVLAKGLQINVAAKLMPALRANPWYVRR